MAGTVWAITGSRFTADAARAETFKSTGGARGVTLPGDLKVTATGTPSNMVQIAPGGATLPAGYPQAPGQSYGVLKPATETLAVPATGSGAAATRYLILRVTDPQFEGSAPANPLDGPYDSYQLVSSITNLPYPYVHLATINQPASTATITNAMIYDARKLVAPRETRQLYCNVPVTQDLTSTTFIVWPSYAPFVDVPDWATHVTAVARVHGASMVSGTSYGLMRLTLGTLATPSVTSSSMGYDINTPGSAGNGERIPTLSVILGDAIPLAMRGTQQKIKMEALKSNTPVVEAGWLRADSYTQVEYDVQFNERAI